MKKYNIKCSCCGGSDLVEGRDHLPFTINGDAWLHFNNENMSGIYICMNCGHIEMYNVEYVNMVKEKNEKIKECNDGIKKCEKQIEELKKQPFFANKYKDRICDLNKEIKTLESLNVKGEDTTSRKEKIKELEGLLSIAKETDEKISKCESKIREYEKELKSVK